MGIEPNFDLPQLTVVNTQSRKKEVVTPQEPGHIRMYTCGPTVYNRAHIGNFRTYVFEDLLRRTMKLLGFRVTQVMNLTDVDDKTIKGAIAQGVDLDTFTAPFKQAFFEDLETLGIEKVEHYPAATDYIAEMIEMIQVLLDKKAAYQSDDGSVYFKIGSFPHYGCLSNLKLDELQAGASERVASDEYDKQHISDFVLWKGYDSERDGDIYWESPFGKGRPGWHLECSTMAMSILGETIDLHCGGVDNIFPHHENEIAQSEACSGKAFVKTWMHSEHLIVDGKKMAKSAGNFFSLQDLLDQGYSGKEVRYMLLQTHYRTQLNFTFEELAAVRVSLKRLNGFIERLQGVPEGKEGGHELEETLQRALKSFTQALADDLNISVALAAVFELSREINALYDADQLGYAEAQQVLGLLKQIDHVLGVLSFEREEDEVPAEINAMLEQRIEARESKNWALSDELRDRMKGLGWLVEDTPSGQKIVKQ